MALLGFADNFVRVIAEDAGLWQFHLVRSLMAMPLLWLLARATGGTLVPRRTGRVLARSAFNAAAMFLYFGSLAFMPIGVALAGLFTAPIFVLVILVAVYGHRIGPVRIAAVALGFAGILMVIRPGAEGLTALALMPAAAGLFYAVSNIATRAWCAGEGAVTLTAGYFLMMLLASGAALVVVALAAPAAAPGAEGFLTRGWVAPTGRFLFWTGVQAVASVAAIAMTVRGYQLAEASYVSVFEYALLVFAAGWAWMIFAEVPDALALVGMAAIVLAGVAIALRSR
ncbi:MAG: DMT family transporter [Rhodobacteraceae bacterium]|nr:DMT family transporter [Paracoccaceae bacterium]